MAEFVYAPSRYVPFREVSVIEKARKISRADITKHWNPEFHISVLKDDEVPFRLVADIFYRIKKAQDDGKKVVLLLPNPIHSYQQVATLINLFRVDCSHVHCFMLDEYADENGNIAPDTWPMGLISAFKENFYRRIDPKLRPPESQIMGPTTSNIKDYGKIIADAGGADACYTGPGWTGHIAFIEPDAPEFDFPLDEWKKLGPRVVTLSPFTIAQNSLHASFGKSGDLAAVPPKAATIGPAEVLAARYRMDLHFFSVGGTSISWQRMISRLVLHGPVTPLLPTSILQTVKTDVLMSETVAQDVVPMSEGGY